MVARFTKLIVLALLVILSAASVGALELRELEGELVYVLSRDEAEEYLLTLQENEMLKEGIARRDEALELHEDLDETEQKLIEEYRKELRKWKFIATGAGITAVVTTIAAIVIGVTR